MNSYEEKQERKRERFEELAQKNRDRSVAEFKKADLSEAATGIPLGQPILVGHHSEGRHRRTLERADNAMRRSIDADNKADYYESKAAGVGTGGISSDDPEAVTKLKTKLDNLERDQRTMKAINAAWRKEKKPAPDNNEAWQRIADILKIGEAAAFCLNGAEPLTMLRLDMARDPLDRAPFTYQLSNNNGNMKRIRERIAQLEQRPTENTETERNGIKIVENADENRIQLIFDGKPPAEVRSTLKSQGFRWSRYNTAWQRHLNAAGRYAASYALDRIEALS